MAYKVRLDVFEGPFDLLVYLIESAEMSIYDIRISEITGQYMEYIANMEKRDPVVTGEFMSLAATLIQIKSKMLLPRLRAEGEGESMEDPRTELVRKLLEYKRCKAQAEALLQQEEQARLLFFKPKEDLSVYTKEPDEVLKLDMAQFAAAFCAFLERKKRIEEVERHYSRVERQRMSVEARIEEMKNLLKTKKQLKFQELVGEQDDNYHVVLTFISLLELLRQKTISVRQNVNFGEITVSVIDGKAPVEESAEGGADVG